MLSLLEKSLFELKEQFKRMPIIYITILFLGCIIFFYQDVPEAFMPIVLLSSNIVLFLSEYVTNLSKIKKLTITIITCIFICQIYYFFLNTYNSLVEQSALSLMYLYLFFSINLYLSSSKNYVLEIKTKIIHILISLSIFVATYTFLYFSIFFIHAIISGRGDFFYSYAYSRITNSITVIVFFSILSIYKKRKNYNSSKFFIFIFSRFVTTMLIFFLSLAFVYFLKTTIKYDSKINHSELNYIITILTFLIFLSLIMIQITDNVKKILKILFSIAVADSIMIAIFYLRYTKLSSGIHYLLIYLLIAIYFLVILLKTKNITYLASYFITLIILIYFIPVIGLINYENFIIEKDNNITTYRERKKSLTNPQKEALENLYYSAPYSNEKVRWIIENGIYSDILIDVHIGINKNNKENFENSRFIYKDYEFNLSKDGKILTVKNILKNLEEEFDLYNTKKDKNSDEIIEFDSQYFKLILSRYLFSEYNKNINFNVYFYDTKK